jgi:hypothetical protein
LQVCCLAHICLGLWCFLEGWTIYNAIMSLSVLGKCLCYDISLPDSQSAFFWSMFIWYIIFHLLYFQHLYIHTHTIFEMSFLLTPEMQAGLSLLLEIEEKCSISQIYRHHSGDNFLTAGWSQASWLSIWPPQTLPQ